MKSSSSQAESQTQTGPTDLTDPIVQFLKDTGTAVTLDNYIFWNFDGSPSYEELEAEQRAQIPEFLKPKKGS